MEFLTWLEIVGGICTLAAAREQATARELAGLLRDGRLWRPRRGWLALSACRNDATRALELGGVLSCVSALREHGLWTPHGDSDLHIRVCRNSHGPRVADAEGTAGIVVHRLHEQVVEEEPWIGIDDARTTLAIASGCLAPYDLIAAADSALAQGMLQPESLTELAASLPARRRRVLERASALSGSGTESTFAAMLRRARIRFVQQPELLPGEYVDFLIGRSLVVEIDSLEWHGSRQQMANDRRRDAALAALGYRVVRFTYEQVLFEPEYVRSTVLGLVRRGVHRRALLRADAAASDG